MAPNPQFISKANWEFELKKEPTEEELNKMAPQKAVLIKVLKGLGGRATRKAFVEALTPDVLKTRQGPDKILTYYQSQMVSAGYVQIHEPAGETTTEKKSAPKSSGDAKEVRSGAAA